MAYSRATTSTKIKGDSLDTFVSNLGKAFDDQLTIRNADAEIKFNQMVLEQDISLEAQLEYRKNQLKEIQIKDEKKRISGEVSTLTQRIGEKKFTDQYTEKLINLSSGVESIDNVLQWLKDSKATATDQNIIDAINKQITDKEATRYSLVKQTMENETSYAVTSKEASIINDQINKVNTARSKALLSGDNLLVSSYDLQLQTLKKTQTENSIQKDMTNFAVSAISGYTTALDLLDSYNSKIASANYDGPVTVGGTTYGSAKEFWTYKRDSYLSDNSKDGFFTQFKSEVDNKIKTDNSKNTLTQGALSNKISAYDSLSSRPELQSFNQQIQTYKQDSLQTGANLVADNIYNNYSTDYDINTAVGGLNALKDLGANVSDSYSKVLTLGSQIKSQQVSNILSTANNLVQTGLSPEQAISQAIAQGAGATISPKEAVTKTEGQIAGGFATGATNSSFTNDPRLTISSPSGTTPPAPTSTPTSTPPATGGSSIVDFLNSKGQDSSYGARAKLAQQYGIQNYTGSAAQNTQLLGILSSQTNTKPVATVTTPTPTQPAPQPVAAPKSAVTTPAPSTGKIGATYTGISVVDFLNKAGQASDFTSRSKLAQQYGIQNYTGTAEQNTKLLTTLKTKY